MHYPPSMRRLVNELSKLPSVGGKTAERLAYHLMLKDPEQAYALSSALKEARDKTCFCSTCFALCEGERCAICSDPSREQSLLCIVEKPADALALERSRAYRGRYHVLHGLWSPLRGNSLEKTKIAQLLERLSAEANRDGIDKIEELILATGATVEGEATAMFIAEKAKELGLRTSRIAQGLPKGGELEYADELTLSHALTGRRQLA